MQEDELVEEPPKRSRARTLLLGLAALLFVALAFLAFAVGRLVLTVNETAEGAARVAAAAARANELRVCLVGRIGAATGVAR